MAYSGRVGTIVTEVQRLYNDRQGGFVKDADILAWLNMLQSELADEEYWEGDCTINTTASTGTFATSSISTFTGLTGYTFVKLISIYWIYGGVNPWEIIEVTSRQRIQEALQVIPTGETVRGYYKRGGTINWIPVPTTSLTAAMRAFCFVCPPAMTGASGYDAPATPAAYDWYYIYGALEKAASMDLTRVERQALLAEYGALKQQWKQKLLMAGLPVKNVVSSYRR